MNALDVMETLEVICGSLPYTADHDEDGNSVCLREEAAEAFLDDTLRVAALIVRGFCQALPDDALVQEGQLNNAIRSLEKTRGELDKDGYAMNREATMRVYAVKCDEDPDDWALPGLLHDFDWEIHPTLAEHPQ